MVTAWQGNEATAQTWPAAELPPEIPLTFHVTAGLEVPLTWTASVMRWLMARVAEAGETATEMA